MAERDEGAFTRFSLKTRRPTKGRWKSFVGPGNVRHHGEMSADLVFTSAGEHTLVELADLFTRGFENYVIPTARVDREVLARHVRREGIDLADSRVISRAGEPIALALIARRGHRSRLAAMGIAKECRGMGVGSALVRRLVEDARARRDVELSLEVIESNAAAVALYTHAGFRPLRRLVGYHAENVGPGDDVLTPCQPDTLGRVAARDVLGPLPWQLEPATLMQATVPNQCFHLDERAFALVGSVSERAIGVAAVYTLPEHRRQGWARRLLGAVAARFVGRALSVPQIWPEDVAAEPMRRLGFVRAELTQREMTLTL